ncbi:unnamed protein product, partial [Didymodactylos carnosus]
HKSDSEDEQQLQQEETPRNRHRKSITHRNRNEESSENEGESNNEEEEHQQQHERYQTGKKKQTLKKQNSEQFSSISTADLLLRHKDCGKDQRTSNMILQELNKRAQGKSTGPLLTPSDVAAFTKYTQMYSHHDAPSLSHIYLQLQQKISSITEPDILNIARVPADLLLEIAVLFTLITQKNTMMNYPNSRHASISSYNTNNEQLFRENSMYGQQPFSPDLHFDRPCIDNTDERQQNFPTMAQNRYSHSRQMNSGEPTPFNYPLQTNYYPQSQNRPFYSNQTSFEPIHDPKPVNTKNVQGNSYQSSSSQMYPNVLQQDPASSHVQSPPPPPPPPVFTALDQSVPSSLGSPYDVLSSRAGSAFAMITPKSDSPDFAIISANSPTNDLTFLSSSSVLITDLSEEVLQNANIPKLLQLYNDASATNKRSVQHSVYGELERRCYGNNPQLIKDNFALYDMKMNEHDSKTQVELEQLYSQLKQQIQTKINFDATHINDIPKELIIEAGAVLHAIQKKKKANGE